MNVQWVSERCQTVSDLSEADVLPPSSWRLKEEQLLSSSVDQKQLSCRETLKCFRLHLCFEMFNQASQQSSAHNKDSHQSSTHNQASEQSSAHNQASQQGSAHNQASQQSSAHTKGAAVVQR